MTKPSLKKINTPIYLDHSATTPLDKTVLRAMTPYFTEHFANASSVHSMGQKAAVAVDNARRKVAELLKAKPSEIFFTSGGTECCNWALKGLNFTAEKNKVLISGIEHAACLSSADFLENMGAEVVILPCTKDGFITPSILEKHIDNKTALVCVMLANNEVGTIQPIKELAAIAKKHGSIFFCDAVQAAPHLDISPANLGVDMLAISSHKFYGPKGVGALYIRSGLKVFKHITGGHQERSMRGGTTNVPSIVGFAAALEKTFKEKDKNYKKLLSLRNYFITEVQSKISHVILNGSLDNRLPHNANFTFEFIEGESLLLSLDLSGICCSSGSACSSGDLSPSHVLIAMGIPEIKAHGSLRFTFGKNNTKQEVDFVVAELKKQVERLRKMSPLYNA